MNDPDDKPPSLTQFGCALTGVFVFGSILIMLIAVVIGLLLTLVT